MSEPLHDPDHIDWSHPFWSKVAPEALTGCWLWMGAVKAGHCPRGQWSHRLSHRHAFALCNGPIPSGAMVLHRCDVTLCVNPAHLYAGNAQRNSDDMAERDRSTWGERNVFAKATELLVRSIRLRALAGDSYAAIAADVHLSVIQVYRIVTGRSWRRTMLAANVAPVSRPKAA